MAFGRATAGLWGQEPDGRHDLPCVRVADFDRERLTATTPVPTLRSVPPRDRPGRLLGRGDLLIEKSGGGERQPVGRVVFFDGEGEAVSSNFIARLPSRPKHSSRYSLYLHAALYSSGWNRLSIKQTTGIQNLDLDAYLDLKWRFPPFDEQQAIADYLDRQTAEIVDLVEKNRRNIRLLTEERHTVVHRAVTQGLDAHTRLRASAVPWLGDVPEHWSVQRVKAVTQILNGGTPSTSVPSYWDGPIRWITPDDLGGSSGPTILSGARSITTDGYAACGATAAPAGSIVLSTRAPIGHVAILSATACANQGCRILVPRRIRSEYLYYLIVVLKDELVSLGRGSTFSELSASSLGGVRVPTPPITEQAAIVRHLDKATADIEVAIAEVRREIELLKEYRARLIADVVTGRLDVREAADSLPGPNEEGA